jgi:ribosomal protein S18 acetylase RimI-like enzyme
MAEQSRESNIEGHIRPYRDGDIPALVALVNAINRAYNIPFVADEESYARRIMLPGWPPSTSIFVAEDPANRAGQALAGMVFVLPAHEIEGYRRGYEVVLSIHPSYEGHGLERLLAKHFVNLIRSFEAEHGDLDPEDVLVQGFTAHDVAWRKAMWESFGMREVRRWFGMQRSLDTPITEPAEIAGLTLRPYSRPQDDAPAFEAAVAAFADHYGFEREHWVSAWQDWNNRTQSRLDLSWVAEINSEPGKLAGVVICYEWQTPSAENGLDRPECLITSVATVREWRGRGVAHNLLLHTLRTLKDAGFGSVILNVDGESTTRANHVYETVGFHVDQCTLQYEAPLSAVSAAIIDGTTRGE